MVRAYWKRVHQRAVKEARIALWLESRERVVIIFVLSVVVIALLWLLAGQQAAIDETIVKIAGTSALLLFFPIVYCWKFICAPAKMEKESNDRVLVLTNRLVEQDTMIKITTDKKVVVGFLGVLYGRGRDIFAEHIVSDNFADWRNRAERWQHLTLSFIASRVSQIAAVKFKNAVYNANDKFSYAVSVEHNSILCEMRPRLEALDSILEEYKDYWSPMFPEQAAHIDQQLEAIERKLLNPDGNKALDQKDGSKPAPADLIP